MKPLSALLAMLLTVPTSAMAGQDSPQAEHIAALVARHAQLDMHSGTVIVAHGGNILYSGSHGEANKDHRVPNRMDTRYNIGSIGKVFTAVAIMQLVEAGKLRLDDTLSKHLPDVPFPEKDAITLQHLLNHSSGLGDYMEHADYRQRMQRIHTIADILPLIYAETPQFAPGERFGYSNSGMVLLGAIIEKVSGLAYPDYLQQHIFGPAGMTHSGLAQEDDVLANRSTGYLPHPGGGYRANVREIMPASADGGLRTTAPDLLRFDQALASDRLLSAASQQQMVTPTGPVPFYANGWFVKRIGDRLAVGHGGGAPGINAEFRRYPDAGYTLVVLSNYDMGATPLAEEIEKVLFGQPYALPTRVDADHARAQQFIEQGHVPAALSILDRLANARHPHLPSLYAGAKLRISAKTELEQAVAALARYIERAGPEAQPSRAAAWWRTGNAYELIGKPSDAKRSYEAALRLDPDDSEARASLERLQQAATSP